MVMAASRVPICVVFIFVRHRAQAFDWNTNGIPDSMTKTVLIVEDEPLIAMLVESMVSELGMTPRTSNSIADAFRIADEERPDAALVDLNLWGRSGADVVRDLLVRGIPTAIMSGSSREDVPAQFGAVPMLEKPFQQDALERFLKGIA